MMLKLRSAATHTKNCCMLPSRDSWSFNIGAGEASVVASVQQLNEEPCIASDPFRPSAPATEMTRDGLDQVQYRK